MGSTLVLPELSPSGKKYVKALLAGKSGTRAAKEAKPHLKDTSAAVAHSRMIRDSNIRAHITAALQKQGINEDIALQLPALLKGQLEGKESEAWQVDRALKHLRAILGLDAVKESILHVEKKSVNIEVRATLDELDQLISSTR